ncbi:MAG: PBP1A family penicillin-binding protein [Syntrophomonadaceae bacterium]|nr:PBP1A family penicillin-binding protein [Syntrophomonadaceae bacterium]
MFKVCKWIGRIFIIFFLIGIFNIVLLNIPGCSWGVLPAPRLPFPAQIFDVNGQLIGSIDEENREEVALEEVAPFFLEAIVAIEDSRFYEHNGIDFRAVIRALVTNFKKGRIVEGGSTITQQTAKNLYLTPERTWNRKIKELYYAMLLENQLTKQEILQLYINQIYFGHGAYGVQMAARTFFNKTANNLTAAESALLAGLTRSPRNYSPFLNPESARERRNVVLNRMVELGKLSAIEAEQIKKEPVQVVNQERPSPRAAYIIDEIREYIITNYPDGASMLNNDGLAIYTTIDLQMQEAAEKAFTNGLAHLDSELNGALVAIEPMTGHIKAMLGGRNYRQSKFNRAFQAKRQPGSAFKPFVYTAVIDWGYTPARMVQCEPVAYPQPDGTVYAPKDFSKSPYHYCGLTLKEALMVSDNVIAVRLNQEIGPSTTIKYAERMGIQSELGPYLSLALGTSEVTPLEMAAAFSPLASGGYYAEPTLILRITNRAGQVLEQAQTRPRAVLDARTAYIITDMLQGVLQPGGTAAHLAPLVGRPAAGKTGTTQERRDAWFVGYTPELVTAVYIGYDQPDRPVGVGGSVAGPIWANFTREALKTKPVRYFTRPPGIVMSEICAESGAKATFNCPRRLSAAFREGTEPLIDCSIHPTFENQTVPLPNPGLFP